jgi:hypothetical protein
MSIFQIHQFSILHFGTCKSGKIDAKGMDVAKPIWLSGCPGKGHFNSKNTKNAF